MKARNVLLAITMILVSNLCFGSNDNPRSEVLQLALKAYKNVVDKGLQDPNRPIVTIIDYSLPSNVDRLWVLDVKHNKILFHSLVAHGKGSGDVYATRFSNSDGTHASSLGVFITENTYIGKHGYSLKIKGLEKGFNDNALARTIVIHSAWYVNREMANSGRIGRSWGCPAVDTKIATPLINEIKDHTVIVAYYNDQKWLHQSSYIN
jgi:hypothetical protein